MDNRFSFFLAHGLDLGMIGYLVAGFFVAVVYYPFFWYEMAMIVALKAVAKKLVIEGKDESKTVCRYKQEQFI